MKDIAEQVILITGATDGLGRETAIRIAQQGATVLLHGRNAVKGEALLQEIKNSTGNDKVYYYNADLSSLDEVRQLAKDIRSTQVRLDVLVNNAGIGPISPDSPRQTTVDGHELFFAVNYLAGYLLTHELLPLLKNSVPSRIINVASIGQLPLNFDDIMMKHSFDDADAYRQSKLAQILFTFDLAETLKDSGITVNCLHPATLMNTKMVNDSDYFPSTMNTVEAGAEALEHLIVSDELEGVSGQFFDGKKQSRPQNQAYDLEARRQLDELSQELTQTS